MADEARAPDPRTPPPPPDPRRGNLRVSGAPKKPPMIPWSPRRFITILLGLFILNWLIVAVFAPPEKRIEMPYSPNFLAQVRKDNVKEISSTGDTVKGEFKEKVEYNDDRARDFETEIPTFANDRELSKLLEEHGVVISASPRSCSGSDRRSSLWRSSSSSPVAWRAAAAAYWVSSAAAARAG